MLIRDGRLEMASVTMPAGRLLALDWGEVRVGTAITDELHITVRPLDCLQRTSWKNQLQTLARLIAKYEIAAIVIGLPLRLDGSYGDAARGVQRVAEHLSRSLALPVFLHDERLTSFAAEQMLRAENPRANKRDRRESIDSRAAALILDDFLAANYAARKTARDDGE